MAITGDQFDDCGATSYDGGESGNGAAAAGNGAVNGKDARSRREENGNGNKEGRKRGIP